jgi:hypothetical protein
MARGERGRTCARRWRWLMAIWPGGSCCWCRRRGNCHLQRPACAGGVCHGAGRALRCRWQYPGRCQLAPRMVEAFEDSRGHLADRLLAAMQAAVAAGAKSGPSMPPESSWCGRKAGRWWTCGWTGAMANRWQNCSSCGSVISRKCRTTSPGPKHRIRPRLWRAGV